MGGAIAKEVLKTNKHIVTAITRQGSKSDLPQGAKIVEVDYNKQDTLISALQGQQFLVISLSVSAPPDLHGRIVKAAGEAGVPYVMPNLYGGDIQNPAVMMEGTFGENYKKRLSEFEGVPTSWIGLVCGQWYEWSLALKKIFFGIDISEKSVTFFDDGNAKVDVSTWDQCGRAVAALLSLPETGSSPCVADWKNKPLYINSYRISQRDMLDSVHRVLNTTDADWEIDFETTEHRYRRGLEETERGNRVLGFALASYGRIFSPRGEGDFSSKWGTANELLGLPREDLDETTKTVVGMIESGWSPYG